jgi:hypothetical protein
MTLTSKLMSGGERPAKFKRIAFGPGSTRQGFDDLGSYDSYAVVRRENLPECDLGAVLDIASSAGRHFKGT